MHGVGGWVQVEVAEARVDACMGVSHAGRRAGAARVSSSRVGCL